MLVCRTVRRPKYILQRSQVDCCFFHIGFHQIEQSVTTTTWHNLYSSTSYTTKFTKKNRWVNCSVFLFPNYRLWTTGAGQRRNRWGWRSFFWEKDFFPCCWPILDSWPLKRSKNFWWNMRMKNTRQNKVSRVVGYHFYVNCSSVTTSVTQKGSVGRGIPPKCLHFRIWEVVKLS